MPDENGIRTHAAEKRRAATPTPRVPTPASARWVVTLGGGAALLAAAAISFEGLSGLGQMIGIRDPWLMPASIDIYASTSALAALLLPEGHNARGAAVWNARLGLAMSMVGNAAFRAFHLGAFTLQDWVLTFIGTWPPAIVERLLHLQGRVNGAGEIAPVNVMPIYWDEDADDEELTEETGNDAGNRQTPAVDDRQTVILAETDNQTVSEIGNPADNDNLPPRQLADDNPVNGKSRERQKPPVKQSAAGQPSTDTWVWIGKPVYEELRAELGKRPGETVFHGALSARVDQLIAGGELVGENKDEKPDVYADPSLSTAKRIRGEIETRFPGIMFGHAAEQQDDTTEAAA